MTGAPAGFYTSTPTAGNAVQSADRDGSLSNADGVSLKTRCFRGESIEVPAYLGPTYTAQGAQSGPCPPDLAPPLLSIAPPPPEPFTLGGAGFTFDPAGNAGPGSAPFNINYDDPPSSAPANIEAGETSNWLVVRTNRTAFGRVIAHVSAGDGTAVVATLGPLGTAVPGDRNPIANPETLERYPAQSIKVLVTTLLANDTDPDGDTPLSLTAVSVAASGQATVSLSGAYVFYQPAAGFTGSDSFTYALSDGHGGSATGTVTVNIKPDTGASQNVTNIEMLGDGSVRTSFAGIPNRTYRIQSTESLTPLAVWTTRASFTANAVGEFQFTDPPVLPPQRFYRSIYP